VFGFLFRLLTLRSLTNDHYLYLAWAQQVLLGELPERDFVDPGIPLQGLLSAAAQAVAPSPASEGTLTTAMLAVAAFATCVGVAWLTRSVTAGALAALFQILAQPRLYSYPKILVPAVFLVLALAYAHRPRTRALLMMAMWIALAFLLRHDLGAYVAVGGAATVALSGGTIQRRAIECARLTAAVLLILLPYFIYVEWNNSIVEHLRASFEYGKAEVHLFGFEWPVFTLGASTDEGLVVWTREDATAFLFYATYILVPLSPLVLVRRAYRADAATRAVVIALAVVGAFYAAIILRHPLVGRVQDLAATHAILGAWCLMGLVRLIRESRSPAHLPWRVALGGGVAVVLAASVLSLDALAEMRVQLREAKLLDPPRQIVERTVRAAAGPEWPWPIYWPAGPVPPVVDYLHACTRPDQRVWVTWPSSEYFYFARRGFGAGHALLPVPHSYTTARDQELMIARLESHQVPVVLINETTRPEFSMAYPRVDQYLNTGYVAVGEFTIRDGSRVLIAVRRELTSKGVYGEHGWPCHFGEAT
jgi:hypothetical protein